VTSAVPIDVPVSLRRVLDELDAWRPRFERGELEATSNGRPAPPTATGERFAIAVHGIRAAGLGHPSSPGALHVTDRWARVLGDDPRPAREWRLTELECVSALGNWRGLTLVRAGGETELVVAVTDETPTWQDAAGWLKVEGAFAAAAGRLAGWAAELPARLTAAGHV
jgi:hypothetical protein